MIRTKTIGRLPQNYGNYDSSKTYGKKQRCFLYGCEWESKMEGNTYAPAILNTTTGVITPDTAHWIHCSGSYNDWLIDNGYKKVDAGNVKDGNSTQHEINAALAQGIADETQRAQNAENDRYTKSEVYTKAEVNSMITTPNQEYVSVKADNTWTAGNLNTLIDTAAGSDKQKPDTIYRVGSWDGSQFDDTVYSEYAWNGTDYVHLSLKTKTGEVFDISAYHATGGTLQTYTDLADALTGTNGGVPQTLQKGGMSVKFVQSSDNKYVQYRLMSDSFNTAVANWQGADDDPTAGSDNLVKSGGVYEEIGVQEYKDSSYSGNQGIEHTGMYVNANKTYSISNKGTYSTNVLVDGHSESGEFIKVYAGETKNFAFPYTGEVQLYVLSTGSGTVDIEIVAKDSLIQKVIDNKNYTEQGFYNIDSELYGRQQYFEQEHSGGGGIDTTGVQIVQGREYSITNRGGSKVNVMVYGHSEIGTYIPVDINETKKFSFPYSGEMSLYVLTSATVTVDINLIYTKSFYGRISTLEEEAEQVFTIAQSGGDYTSIVECFNALKNNTKKKTIFVEGGEYDILQELGGQSYIDSMPADTSADDWAAYSNVLPPNSKLIGVGEVTLLFRIPDSTATGKKQALSALACMGSFEIENITIISENCRYGLHDEDSINYSDCIKKLKNVKLYHNGYAYQAAYGNGHGKNVTMTFDNCIFSGGRIVAWSCHTNLDGDHSTITFNNCAFLHGMNGEVILLQTHNNNCVNDVVFNNCYIGGQLKLDDSKAGVTGNIYKVNLIRCNEITVLPTEKENPYVPVVIGAIATS